MADDRVTNVPGESGGETEDLLTLEEALQFLGTSKATLYRLLGQGDLKGLKVGRQWRFRKPDLMAYMQRGPVAIAAAPTETMETELSYLAEQLRQMDAVDPAEYSEARDSKGAGTTPEGTASENEIALLVSRILALAISRKASDIHIEPAR